MELQCTCVHCTTRLGSEIKDYILLLSIVKFSGHGDETDLGVQLT